MYNTRFSSGGFFGVAVGIAIGVALERTSWNWLVPWWIFVIGLVIMSLVVWGRAEKKEGDSR